MLKTKPRAIVFGILCGFLLIFLFNMPTCASCDSNSGQQSDRISETRILLDTYCTITISNTDNTDLINDAFDMCEQYEAVFSMHKENSDVWRINNAGGENVIVGYDTLEVIEKGVQFGELSGGMFDITIGRLSSQWDFSGGNRNVPAQSEREKAALTVDYRNIVIDGNTVRLENPETWLDLGGIAKGYIADLIAGFLTERGVDSAIIDLGGDIVVIGSRADGTPWRLGVNKPVSGRDELVGVLEVSDAAVVSSGVYERQFIADGVQYHHIIDPFTTLPVISDVISATIIADDAVTGEGLSTIAVLVGSEMAREICLFSDGFIGAVLILDNYEVITFGEVVYVSE